MSKVLRLCQHSIGMSLSIFNQQLFKRQPDLRILSLYFKFSILTLRHHTISSLTPWKKGQTSYCHCTNQAFHLSAKCTFLNTRNEVGYPFLLSNGFKLFKDASLQYRLYHSRSNFSLENPLFDSYLQSLLDELKECAQKSPQLSPSEMRIEPKGREHFGRLQFLKESAEMIQRLYERQKEVQDLEKIMECEEEAEMKSLMIQELGSLKECLAENEEELINILVGEDPADRNGVILEVSAGVGGQEAMLFCAELFSMYYNYGLAKGWDISIVSKDLVELGGCRKASIEINGLDVYKHLKNEAGVHRVQRIPKTEKAGRIHTSTVSVSVLPQPREVDVQIEKKDIKVETFRNSGPGGQAVNTTDSAVRITHLPTGTVSECRQERSQIKNKEIAMKRLKLRIYQTILEREEAQRQATRKMQMGTRGRSEKIRTYNFQQDRITDHRVKGSQSNLPEFMMGGEDLDDMISKVDQEYKYQTLESMLDEFESASRKHKN